MLAAMIAGVRLSPFALLLNPAFWIAQFVLMAVIAMYCADYGAEQERFKQQAIQLQAQEALAKINATILQRERDLRTLDRLDFDQYRKEKEDAEKISAVVVADLLRDARRLRIPVRRQVCSAGNDASGPAPTGSGETELADVDPGIAVALVNLTDRGDSAIRQHGEVVDRYERLRIACTTPINPNPTESP